MRQATLLALGILCANGAALAAGTFVIGGPTVTLAPSSGSYSIEGTELAGYRGAVTNAANFGPSGTVKTSVSFSFMNTITAQTLSQVNAFLSPWWYSTDSASYNQLVVNYFLAGGNLILLDDNPGKDGIASLLGIPTLGQADGSVENGSAPLFSGPFGTATNVNQFAQIGYFSGSAITSHGGSICATNAGGQPTAACFATGAYAKGAGAMIIINDIDSWANGNYTSLDSNAIFALNGTAYIVNSGNSATTSVPALSDWAIVGLAVLLMGAATFLIGRRGSRDAAAA